MFKTSEPDFASSGYQPKQFPTIEDLLQALDQNYRSGKETLENAQENELNANRALKDNGHWVAMGLLQMINVFNPSIYLNKKPILRDWFFILFKVELYSKHDLAWAKLHGSLCNGCIININSLKYFFVGNIHPFQFEINFLFSP